MSPPSSAEHALRVLALMRHRTRRSRWRSGLVAPLTVVLMLGMAAPGHAAKLFVTLSQPHGELPSGPILRYDVPGPSSGATLETTISDPSFDNPLGIAFAPNGDMLVTNRADQFHGSISRISNAQGVPVFNPPITSPAISGPHFPTFRGNELFIPQLGGSNVIRFLFHADGTATFEGEFTTNLCCDTPRAAVVSPSDELFVSQCCLQTIQRYLFDGAGSVIPHGEIVDPRLTNPHRMVFAPWGELFVAQDPGVWGGVGNVYRFVFDAAGNAVPNGVIGTGDALSLTFSPWGELFVGLVGDGSPGVSRWTFDANHTAHANGVIATPQAATEVAFAPPVIGPCEQPGAIRGAGTIVGTPGDDVICGSAGADRIDGLGGNDTIFAQGGADLVDAGPGDDRIRGGAGRDTLLGGADNDDIDGGAGDDVVLGQAGDDSLGGGAGAGADTLSGGTGNDHLQGGPGADQLHAGPDNDVARGGPGNDVARGGPGNDIVAGGIGDDTVSGGGGADRVLGEAGGDGLSGGAASDVLIGGPGLDVMRGGGADDTLLSIDGVADTDNGGPGTDRCQADPIDQRISCESG